MHRLAVPHRVAIMQIDIDTHHIRTTDVCLNTIAIYQPRSDIRIDIDTNIDIDFRLILELPTRSTAARKVPHQFDIVRRQLHLVNSQVGPTFDLCNLLDVICMKKDMLYFHAPSCMNTAN